MWITSCTYHPLTLCDVNYILHLVFKLPALPCNKSPLVAFCISERRSQANKPETNRPSYRVGPPDARCDCFEIMQEEEKCKTFMTSILIIHPRTLSPTYKISSDSSGSEGTVLEALACCGFPFAWQRIKSYLSFPPKTLSPYSCSASVHREPRFFWQQGKLLTWVSSSLSAWPKLRERGTSERVVRLRVLFCFV